MLLVELFHQCLSDLETGSEDARRMLLPVLKPMLFVELLHHFRPAQRHPRCDVHFERPHTLGRHHVQRLQSGKYNSNAYIQELTIH